MNAFGNEEHLDIIADEIKKYTIRFRLGPELVHQCDIINLGGLVWQEVKFLDGTGNLHLEMSTIPNDKGGIYIFFVKNQVLPQYFRYIMYIGRAEHTHTQNLRKRCREYKTDIRDKIRNMRRLFGHQLYIMYTCLTDNQVIDELEKRLIDGCLPPYNSQITNLTVRHAVRAFGDQ